MNPDKQQLIERANDWLADYPDPDPISAAPDLIRDMRDALADMHNLYTCSDDIYRKPQVCIHMPYAVQVEKVARAIYEAYVKKAGADDDYNDFFGEAKAALAAIGIVEGK